MVNRNLTEQQWDTQLSVCADLLEQVEVNPQSMDRVITGDKSWFFKYDPEMKHQNVWNGVHCDQQGHRKHTCPSQK
jgi:hypothetical protein